jgi:hypothetical protein
VANSSIYQQFNATGQDNSTNNTYARGLEEAIESAYHYGRWQIFFIGKHSNRKK